MSRNLFIGLIVGLCLINTGLLGVIRKNISSEVMVVSVKPPNEPIVKKQENEEQVVRIRAVGDVMLGRSVAMQSKKYGNWRWPFAEIVPHLTPVDYFVGNLEAPIVAECPYRSDGMIFCAPSQVIDGLKYANFDLVSLANNHSMNQGSQGLVNTEELLSLADIVSLRQGNSHVMERKGIQFGLAVFDDISSTVTEKMILDTLAPVVSQSAVQVAMIHWGTEYQASISARQRKVASWLKTAGVDVILGAHPHVIQPIENTEQSLTAYSLGNFVFDQMWSEPTRQGLILDLEFRFIDNKFQSVSHAVTPIKIYDYGQPRILEK